MGKKNSTSAIMHVNYVVPTTKPFTNESYYKPKEVSLQDRVYKKLKKVAELLESLRPTDEHRKDVHRITEKNFEKLYHDLELLRNNLDTSPETFDKENLETNQSCIHEMKEICDKLQTVRSFKLENKKLAKVKHALHEIEQLIEPTDFERAVANIHISSLPAKPAKKPAKKKAVSKTKKESVPAPKPKKSPVKSKKAGPKKNVTAPKKAKSKTKVKAPVSKPKKALKTSSVSKTKKPATKTKKTLATKTKPKESAARKKK